MKNKKSTSIEKKIWLTIIVILITILVIITINNYSDENIVLSETESIKNQYKYNKLSLLLEEAINYVSENYIDTKISNKKNLYYGAIDGLYKATGSKWNSFFDEKNWNSLWESLSGQFTGIGVYITQDRFRKGVPLIVEVIKGSPAEKKGLLPRDRIIKIDGSSTEGKDYRKNIDKIKGERGTTVILTIKRAKNNIFDVAVKRDTIETISVEYDRISKKTAYIKIRSFSLSTDKELTDAFGELYSEGFDNLIMDLRGNPGGVFDTVLKVCDKFIDSGIICTTKGRNIFDNKTYEAHKFNTEVKDKPMVILIDEGTASASEIFAGAMRDNNIATIVGKTSYGKGVVANVVPIQSSESKIGVTVVIQKYFTPNGTDINEVGIVPDIVVEQSEYTDDDVFYIRKLLYEEETDLIGQFIQNNENITDKKINEFQKELEKKGYFISFYALKKEIILERDKHKNRIFNIEIDPQLKKALEILDIEQ